MSIFDQIPGYREAVERERFNRDAAFAEVPQFICGISVQPLCFLSLTRLALVGSPFVKGGDVTPTNLASTLWLLSSIYSPEARFARWRFLRMVRKKPYLQLIREVEKFFADSFEDAPGGGGEEQISYYSTAADICDALCSEYGWTIEQVMRVPLVQLWQLLKAMRRRCSGSTGIMWNPSDKVRGRWLEQVNAQSSN